jgi:hypothetical protein
MTEGDASAATPPSCASTPPPAVHPATAARPAPWSATPRYPSEPVPLLHP